VLRPLKAISGVPGIAAFVVSHEYVFSLFHKGNISFLLNRHAYHGVSCAPVHSTDDQRRHVVVLHVGIICIDWFAAF
jgi:hypothetical protein